ncbi:MAG: hypothetical protein RMK84_11415 [Oscillochloridaceae bacterium]|nr:hypothetical protein [Chloroflexaceae bacterium]MDW8390723.1 hypothetical protein [Oscillochloridaceae bacterium]
MLKLLRHFAVMTGVVALCALLLPSALPAVGNAQTGRQSRVFAPFIARDGIPALVFVSRQIRDRGTIYWDRPRDMPGVGPYSRFRPANPGRLLIREADGTVRTLIDGANPTPATLNLIDVNAPDVSYDGTTIVFAGLPAGNYDQDPGAHPGAWRIYTIGVDGRGLRQVTFSDQRLDLSHLGPAAAPLSGYDDGDPVWLPDGRIVFSSTRWPSFAQYSGTRTTNLFVVNADGSGLRRITAERNGADRPLVDPLTGRIVYARWWRNHRFPSNSAATVADPAGGFRQRDGLTTDRDNQVGGADASFRNAWHAASINPDGTDLRMLTGRFRDEAANHTYGGTFLPNGQFAANFFPMFNMSEAAGFGGIRLYSRGPTPFTPVIGITSLTLDYVNPDNPTSFGVFRGDYAAEPEALSNHRLVISLARDINQDYGLYTVNIDGTDLRPLLNYPGTSELRARAVRPRPLPPIIPDTVTQPASMVPPPAGGPFNQDGTFIFDVLNIYANAPVDSDIISAPPAGSAATLRFFLDHQRTSTGSFPNLDWPILLSELPVSPAGVVRNDQTPANLPLFEQLRDAAGNVPLLPGGNGGAHVAGMNFGRPGEHVRCVGCHAGHSMMPVPATEEEAAWTNLAPGATVTVSSTRDPNYNGGVNDRRVLKGPIFAYWTSAPGQTTGQWVQLTFPVPVTVRNVRLYNPRRGDEANSSLQVEGATVVLYADARATQEVARSSVGRITTQGTDVPFTEVRARAVRVLIDSMSGTFYGMRVASLAEIEVIARAEAP